MLIIIFQALTVGMVVYGLGRLIYALMPSFIWKSSLIRQISKAISVSKGIVKKDKNLIYTINTSSVCH